MSVARCMIFTHLKLSRPVKWGQMTMLVAERDLRGSVPVTRARVRAGLPIFFASFWQLLPENYACAVHRVRDREKQPKTSIPPVFIIDKLELLCLPKQFHSWCTNMGPSKQDGARDNGKKIHFHFDNNAVASCHTPCPFGALLAYVCACECRGCILFPTFLPALLKRTCQVTWAPQCHLASSFLPARRWAWQIWQAAQPKLLA